MLGQALVAAATAFGGYYYITDYHPYDVDSPLLATAVFGLVGLVVGSAFWA